MVYMSVLELSLEYNLKMVLNNGHLVVYLRAICNDDFGRVFVGDFSNNRFLILDGNCGCVLQLIQLGQELPKPIWKMCWVNTQPNLIVHNSSGFITGFAEE